MRHLDLKSSQSITSGHRLLSFGDRLLQPASIALRGLAVALLVLKFIVPPRKLPITAITTSTIRAHKIQKDMLGVSSSGQVSDYLVVEYDVSINS